MGSVCPGCSGEDDIININIILTLELLQVGGGYPGHVGCNNVIPHAKWHAQTAAALSDMTRLMDFVLELENRHRDDRGQVRKTTRENNSKNFADIEKYLHHVVSTMRHYRTEVTDTDRNTKIHCLSH